jgi:hypothetical protein
VGRQSMVKMKFLAPYFSLLKPLSSECGICGKVRRLLLNFCSGNVVGRAKSFLSKVW